MRFSAHFPLLYSTSKDCTLRCWRAHNLQCAAIYRSHNYPIWCLDESPMGQYVVTGSKDLSARLWSLEREHALIIYAGHTQDVEVGNRLTIFILHIQFLKVSVGFSALHSIRMGTTWPLARRITRCVCGAPPAVNSCASSPIAGKRLLVWPLAPMARCLLWLEMSPRFAYLTWLLAHS